MDPTKLEWIARAIAGDPAARTALWREHRRLVATLLLANGGASPRARDRLEDLLQEVALRFVRNVGELAAPGRFEPWLAQIARNVAREAVRRERARPAAQLEDDAIPAIDSPPGLHLERDELLAALAALPAEYREPLALRGIEGLPQRRIAEMLGLPETTIETRLVRGRRLLRERLEASASPPVSPIPRT
jgi:RNA polymerase sigma-70 factor (ECF subfamily)